MVRTILETRGSRIGRWRLKLGCEQNLTLMTYATNRKCTASSGHRQPLSAAIYRNGAGINVDGAGAGDVSQPEPLQ